MGKSKTSHQSSTSVSAPIRNKLSIIVLVIVVVVLASSSLYFQFGLKLPFLNIGNKQTQPTPIPLQTVTTNTAIFTSKTAPILSKTFATVTYKPPAKPTTIWLKLAMPTPQEEASFLLYEPKLYSLTWPSVSSVKNTLYQKKPIYKTIDEFLANPPKETILADRPLVIAKVITGNNVKFIDIDSDYEKADYVLTTYHPPIKDGEMLINEVVLDASKADIINGELSWYLLMPQVSPENPLALKGVDIVYNQPANIIHQ
jgi:hypothetical protein